MRVRYNSWDHRGISAVRRESKIFSTRYRVIYFAIDAGFRNRVRNVFRLSLRHQRDYDANDTLQGTSFLHIIHHDPVVDISHKAQNRSGRHTMISIVHTRRTF
jgi:hypothetical protein